MLARGLGASSAGPTSKQASKQATARTQRGGQASASKRTIELHLPHVARVVQARDALRAERRRAAVEPEDHNLCAEARGGELVGAPQRRRPVQRGRGRAAGRRDFARLLRGRARGWGGARRGAVSHVAGAASCWHAQCARCTSRQQQGRATMCAARRRTRNAPCCQHHALAPPLQPASSSGGTPDVNGRHATQRQGPSAHACARVQAQRDAWARGRTGRRAGVRPLHACITRV